MVSARPLEEPQNYSLERISAGDVFDASLVGFARIECLKPK
jgi:hypothetical protein